MIFPKESQLGDKKWKYCLKGEQTKEEWEEQKDAGPNYGKNVKVIADINNSNQGERTELEHFRDTIKRKAGIDCDLEGELYEEHLPTVAKYTKLMDKLTAFYAKKNTMEYRKITYTCLVGEGGCGKSKRAAYDSHGKRLQGGYLVPNSKDTKWWFQYAGEDLIIINEMNGTRMSYERWKDLVDGGQFAIETKGGCTYANWTKVVYTSNVHPDQWWPDEPKARMEFSEFSRRIGEIIIME